MDKLANIVNTISDSNTLFYFIVLALIMIALILFYLIYCQNKALTEEINKRKQEENKKEYISDKTEIIEKIDTEEEIDHITIEPELSNDENIDLDKTLYGTFNIYDAGEPINPLDMIEEPKKEQPLEFIEEQKEEITLPKSLNEINEKTEEKEIDLLSLTKELETIREPRSQLTEFEAEQEEKAIISYEELLQRTNNVSIEYKDTNEDDDILVKQVDLENTGKIELDPIKKEINSKVSIASYEHEEEFLKALKQLQNFLN